MALQERTTPAVTENGLELLGQVLGLATEPSQPGLEDIVLIAIDFERFHNITEDLSLNLECQAGLAILDTRNIHNHNSEPVISAHNFTTGRSLYCACASEKFLFGTSITTSQKDLLENINSVIPKSRNVILVGHSIKGDLNALKALGFDFEASLVGVLDTCRIAGEVLELWHLTLGELLTELQYPFTKLHCAGNDAYFTLQALILLAVRFYKARIDARCQETMDALESIAYAPVSFHVGPYVRGAKRMAKRLAKKKRLRRLKTQEFQPTGDTEAHEQVRAERASRRLARDSQEITLDWLWNGGPST